VHLLAADVLAPNTAAQNLAQLLLLAAKTRRIPPRPNRLPTDAVTISLSAWRRDCVAANAFVNSSKFVACIFVARVLRAEIAKRAIRSSSSFFQQFATRPAREFAKLIIGTGRRSLPANEEIFVPLARALQLARTATTRRYCGLQSPKPLLVAPAFAALVNTTRGRPDRRRQDTCRCSNRHDPHTRRRRTLRNPHHHREPYCKSTAAWRRYRYSGIRTPAHTARPGTLDRWGSRCCHNTGSTFRCSSVGLRHSRWHQRCRCSSHSYS
jgi:hypothetical protein